MAAGTATRRHQDTQMEHYDLQRDDGLELAGRSGMGSAGCQSKTVSVLKGIRTRYGHGVQGATCSQREVKSGSVAQLDKPQRSTVEPASQQLEA